MKHEARIDIMRMNKRSKKSKGAIYIVPRGLVWSCLKLMLYYLKAQYQPSFLIIRFIQRPWKGGIQDCSWILRAKHQSNRKYLLFCQSSYYHLLKSFFSFNVFVIILYFELTVFYVIFYLGFDPYQLISIVILTK